MNRSSAVIPIGFSCLILAVLIVSTATTFAADNKTQLPDDLLELLPESPVLLAAFRSLNELDHEGDTWRSFFETVATLQGKDSHPASGLKDYLRTVFPDYDSFVDQNRPGAISVSLASPMAMQPPTFCFVLPVKNSDFDFPAIANASHIAKYQQNGDYVLFSTDINYAPAPAVPAVAQDLGDKLAVVRVDLARLFTITRPMIDMGLGSMAASVSRDTTISGPNFTSEDIFILQQAAYDLLDSARLLELTYTKENSQTIVSGLFGLLPGSPLQPPKQPSMDSALKLTAFLPRDEDWIIVSAVDLSDYAERNLQLQRLGTKNQQTGISEEVLEQRLAWNAQLMEILQRSYKSVACSSYIEDGQIDVCALTRHDDTQETVEQIISLMENITHFDGMSYATPIDVPDVDNYKIHGWHMNIDNTSFLDNYETVDTDYLSTFSSLLAIQEKLFSNLYVCNVDDYIIACIGETPDYLNRVLQLLKNDRGHVDTNAASLARSTGSSCQVLATGDLRSIANLVAEAFAEIEPEELPYVLPGKRPLIFNKTLDISEAGYRTVLSISDGDLEELRESLIKMFTER